jgi:hypothetical protein
LDSQKKPHFFNTPSWKCPPWQSRHCCHLHRRTDQRGLLSKAILTHWIFSGDRTVFQQVRALTCTDPVSRHSLIIFLEGAAPRCRSSPNFRWNSHCTETIDFLNTNCSTQNMHCCTNQRSIVHWIQGHTKPNTIVSDPSHNPHKQYYQLKMGNVTCRTLYY